jgi:hypothetical protein
MNKKEVMKKISLDFGYSLKELKTWTWINVEKHPETFDNIFFDGNYVFFAVDEIVWY